MEPNQNPQAHDQYPPSQQPVAYDAQGRPLYAHPQQAQPQPQQVYISRPVEPIDMPISDEVRKLSEDSSHKYPQLNLSDGEYVLSAVRRHPIGILKIWFGAFILIGALLGLFAMLTRNASEAGSLSSLTSDGSGMASIGLAVVGGLTILILIGAFVATYVYNSNRFFLTNESVIQEIQTSLFARHEQTVSLGNIEDASFRQDGIIPAMLNYGTIRLSTQGDETTYRFQYVTDPKQQIALLNNAVEAFKNGRPVE